MSDAIGLALLVALLAVLTALGVHWGLAEVQTSPVPVVEGVTWP